MALSHTDTAINDLKINKFSTLADFQAAYAQGLVTANEISFVDEPLQSNWAQTDSSQADFIKNKPEISVISFYTWTNNE